MPSRQEDFPWPNLFTCGIVLLLLAFYFAPINDLDFTWQIRTGEQILRTGQFRTIEEFTYTIAGQRVLDFEWLYEVILYLVWRYLGPAGLHLLKAVLIAAPLVLLARHLRRQGVPRYLMVLALLAAIFLLRPFWNLRAMGCTTIGLVLVTSWLHDHCTGKRPLSPWLPVVMLLWANLHPGVITGQALLLACIAWEWCNRFVRWNAPLATHQLKRLTVIGWLGLLATLVSPDPIARLLYPFRPELRHPIHRTFAEMQPPLAVLPQVPWLMAGVFLLALVVIVTLVFRMRHFRLWEVALLGGLGVLANTAIRGLPDWILVMMLVGLPQAAILLGQNVQRHRHAAARLLLRLHGIGKRLSRRWWLRIQTGWLINGCLGISAAALLVPVPRLLPPADVCDCPKGAADFIERKGLQGRFFSCANYGSYLGWRLKDHARVYVDTRGFFFPPVLLEDSHMLPQMTADWRQRLHRVLEKYHTDFLLLETTGPRGKLWRWLKARGVRPLYGDEHTVLLDSAQLRRFLKQ